MENSAVLAEQCFAKPLAGSSVVGPLREGTWSTRRSPRGNLFERAVKCEVQRSAPATPFGFGRGPRTRPLLAIQGFPQVHHGDFGVAVDCGDGGVQAGLGQSAERHAEELETPLESKRLVVHVEDHSYSLSDLRGEQFPR